ncbi:bacillithiol biosynthesis deacetylase BshB2 [Sporosarcina aquimarina]|uniref:bacillithiol biosynthesis deacetylase BshB2 n=1 Tax=Sporosarcina aquimarina TaxID=114975 RepID=UPI00203D1518|nr:bacillithiol biosynthesis deacetylase BshB2 [Sporosarcina aquimarina]MCM3756014.1 bacillithiol biosynthesis deacetylase BshB2 [Sporosarcina aquimarina]
MEKERHVLVIFPHPDDEAFGVSGTIATYIEMGVPVTYACLTLGEMGRNLGNPPFANRETLPMIRKKELQASADAMGLTDLRMMGLRDKTVEFEDDEKMVKLVTDLIEELNPSLMISFYPGLSVHPDHDATGRAVVEAIRRMADSERPKLYTIAFDNNTVEQIGHPDVHHDVSGVTERKLGAMNAHASQTVWMMEDMQKRLDAEDPDALRWLKTEHFYTYTF